MHRFKSAVLRIEAAQNVRSIEAALADFVSSLNRTERLPIEHVLGYELVSDSTHVVSVAYDLTRAELQLSSTGEEKFLVAETAQVYIIASNRLAQLAVR